MGDLNILSDHHPISCLLSMCADTATQANEAHMYNHCDYRYSWNPEKAKSFVKKLNSHESVHVFEGMKSKLEESVILSNDIDENLQTFVSIIVKCASPLFLQTLKKINSYQEGKSNTINNLRNAPWLNEDCAERRRIFYTCLNLYRG